MFWMAYGSASRLGRTRPPASLAACVGCNKALQPNLAGTLEVAQRIAGHADSRTRGNESCDTTQYQPTASKMTSGSNCRHLNRTETEGARSIGPAYQVKPPSLQHFQLMWFNSHVMWRVVELNCLG